MYFCRREISKDTIDSEPTEKRDRIADSANQLPLDIQPNPGFLKYLQLKVKFFSPIVSAVNSLLCLRSQLRNLQELSFYQKKNNKHANDNTSCSTT